MRRQNFCRNLQRGPAGSAGPLAIQLHLHHYFVHGRKPLWTKTAVPPVGGPQSRPVAPFCKL